MGGDFSPELPFKVTFIILAFLNSGGGGGGGTNFSGFDLQIL